MADRLTPLLALIAVALAWPAAAQGGPATEPANVAGLPDPTRPPPGFDPSAPSAADDAATKAEAAPVLTSVIIPVKGKALAIIGERVLTVGDLVGELKIVRITEVGVVLQGPEGRETMSLTPGVDKKIVKRTPAKGRARAEKP